MGQMQRYRIYTTEAEPGYFLCGHKDGNVVLASDAEAALKEKDAEIARLKAQIKKSARELTEVFDMLEARG